MNSHSLNPQQQQAVEHHGGPLVVFAGAGSGKTRVITHRIARALSEGIAPYRILAMTFTNKAAREMKQRLQNMSPAGSQVHIGTFHSACARWLREFGECLGYTSQFSIYDQKESKETLKRALEDLRNQHSALLQGTDLKEYIAAISDLKTMGLLPQDVRAFNTEQQALYELPPLTASIYTRYQEILAASNAMDFSDLQLNMLLILKTQPDIRTRLQRRYMHILVDEYQDTNHTQAQLIQHLYHEQCQLCVVGDDDQAIYSWRGADPEHILNFQQHWPQSLEIRLEQNYRCSKHIVDGASGLIRHNKVRADKTLWTSNQPGHNIQLHVHDDSYKEAWEVIHQIESEAHTTSYDHMAILYRTRSQSRAFEEALRHRMIPYQIHGSLAFYERVEIRDLLCWIRGIINPKDGAALRRIINVPARKIGPKAISIIEDFASEHNIDFLESIEQLAASGLRIWSQRFSNFIALYQNIKDKILHAKLESVIEILISTLDYMTYIDHKFDDTEERVEHIHELSAAFHEYAKKYPDNTIDQWLQDLALDDGGAQEGGVNLMTLHAAKGLEFERVFIVGVEDRILPHASCMFDPAQLEEERRLLYVGMTRAAQKLSLHRAEYRRQGRDIHTHSPSRFLKEIPHLDDEQDLAQESSDKQESAITIGQRVEHPSFGLGTITNVRIEHEKKRCIVAFDFVGLRKVDPHQLRHFGKPDIL